MKSTMLQQVIIVLGVILMAVVAWRLVIGNKSVSSQNSTKSYEPAITPQAQSSIPVTSSSLSSLDTLLIQFATDILKAPGGNSILPKFGQIKYRNDLKILLHKDRSTMEKVRRFLSALSINHEELADKQAAGKAADILINSATEKPITVDQIKDSPLFEKLQILLQPEVVDLNMATLLNNALLRIKDPAKDTEEKD